MTRTVPRVRYRGRIYLNIDGALATRRQYAKGLLSFAHIKGDEVWRHHRVICRASELEVCGAAKLPKSERGSYARVLVKWLDVMCRSSA